MSLRRVQGLKMLLRKVCLSFLGTNRFLIAVILADLEVPDDASAGGRGAVGPGALRCHHNPQDARAHAVLLRRANGRRRLQCFRSRGHKGNGVDGGGREDLLSSPRKQLDAHSSKKELSTSLVFTSSIVEWVCIYVNSIPKTARPRVVYKCLLFLQQTL